MMIPYRAVYVLLERFFPPKSLEGIITDCYDSFDESVATAKEIEDYRYLHQMVTQRGLNESRYSFFWDYRHHLPLTLVKDQDLTIDALAKIAIDYERTIRIEEFHQLIESVVDNVNNDSGSNVLVYEKLKGYFDNAVMIRKQHYNLAHGKIQRNDDCPCGSGKKYKFCHGKK